MIFEDIQPPFKFNSCEILHSVFVDVCKDYVLCRPFLLYHFHKTDVSHKTFKLCSDQ